jgi:hypothetical protein
MFAVIGLLDEPLLQSTLTVTLVATIWSNANPCGA